MKAQKFTKETIKDIGIQPTTLPDFNIGDTIAVSQNIKEGDKKRVQIFQGEVIAIRKNGASSTFTVRKIGANSVAVERIYPFNSPIIDSIKFIRPGKVRRAKLFYLRDRVGKAGRVKEKIVKAEDKIKREKAGSVSEAAPTKSA
jgi:large subunit ribosomal protein L19